MTQNADMPEPKGQVSDAYTGNWVDHRAPAWSRPYLRLSRADRPIGTWLLLIPCWWGLLLAATSTDRFGWQDAWVILGCALGAWLMRGAGCTWNDITDRNFDKQVARTRSRPIPSGQVSILQAATWMGLQALIAFAILLSFNTQAILIGVLSLLPVLIYPFAKRFTWWPQAFLGIAFNWGALLGWVAHTGNLSPAPVVLYLAGIAWTLFYDTVYAHQDTEDDTLIGIKSTARLFGDMSPRWLFVFMVATVLLFAAAVILALVPRENPLVLVLALGGVWGMGWHMAWQLRMLDPTNPHNCLKIFRSNRNAGLIPVLFFAVVLWL